ncbi:hypothetical protein [Laspinema palackyanum]|uniref:hypothetical protein n=1 Tax=Laspinema palackyanum TaxID=3231601 RepID=UPI00345C979D|nr:hypothetical protein [Laspinema sp. D2c]
MAKSSRSEFRVALGNAQPPVQMSQVGLCLLCPVDSGKRNPGSQTFTDPDAQGKSTGEANLGEEIWLTGESQGVAIASLHYGQQIRAKKATHGIIGSCGSQTAGSLID